MTVLALTFGHMFEQSTIFAFICHGMIDLSW